jgi:hypothetical protein
MRRRRGSAAFCSLPRPQGWQGVEVTSRASFYLGPRRPRLLVDSWDDMVTAASAGVLAENHWVELKQAVPAGSSANLELAKDLASLSVDGGSFVIGVADDSTAEGAVVGTDLQGLKTRIAQVASGRIDPPLPVTIDVFEKPDESGVGLVAVTVPASEGAPHMVDAKYWGRDDHGKRVLSNDEVRRLLADRQGRAAGFVDRLRDTPYRLDASPERSRGRLYLVLEPGASASEPVSDLLRGKHPLEVIVASQSFRTTWGPSLSLLNYQVGHPDGLAVASIAPGETADPDHGPISLLLADDGTVLVSAPVVAAYGRSGEVPAVVWAPYALEVLHGVIELAAHIANQYTGYQGPWRAGVFVTGLRGLLPSQAYHESSSGRFSPYPTDEYVRTTETTTREMTEEPPAVVERLSKGFLRGLGLAERFLPYADPADIARRAH